MSLDEAASATTFAGAGAGASGRERRDRKQQQQQQRQQQPRREKKEGRKGGSELEGVCVGGGQQKGGDALEHEQELDPLLKADIARGTLL